MLSKHGEYTSREFAREGRIRLRCCGSARWYGRTMSKVKPPTLWVEERDVVQAVSGALTARLNSWQIFHIEQASPRARFSVRRAQTALGYKPQFRW